MANILEVLLKAENESYLQEYVKPYTSNYVIMADNGENVLLGTDTTIGEYYGDNRDGLKEGFALLDFIHINESHMQGYKKLIIYPDKQTALKVLDDDFKEKLKSYFGIDKWVVKRIQTIFYLEGIDNGND